MIKMVMLALVDKETIRESTYKYGLTKEAEMPLNRLECGSNKSSILGQKERKENKGSPSGGWRAVVAERGGCPAAGGDRAQRRPLPESAHPGDEERRKKMPVGKTVELWAVCDRCEYILQYEPSGFGNVRELTADVRARGWTVKSTGEAICPKCKKEGKRINDEDA